MDTMPAPAVTVIAVRLGDQLTDDERAACRAEARADRYWDDLHDYEPEED